MNNFQFVEKRMVKAVLFFAYFNYYSSINII